jgi:hypothetical protein
LASLLAAASSRIAFGDGHSTNSLVMKLSEGGGG